MLTHCRWHTDGICLCCAFSDSLAFATEPVIGSLANVLGNYERLPANVHPEIKVGLNSTDLCTVARTVLQLQVHSTLKQLAYDRF